MSSSYHSLHSCLLGKVKVKERGKCSSESSRGIIISSCFYDLSLLGGVILNLYLLKSSSSSNVRLNPRFREWNLSLYKRSSFSFISTLSFFSAKSYASTIWGSYLFFLRQQNSVLLRGSTVTNSIYPSLITPIILLCFNYVAAISSGDLF